MTDLTGSTWEKVRALFSPEEHERVAKLLEEECGSNLPFFDGAEQRQLDRIRFAVLKLSGGSVEKLESEIELAKIDWRDTLVAAGFAESVDAHLEWSPEAGTEGRH